MQPISRCLGVLLGWLLALGAGVDGRCDDAPVRVFLFAGQSNMVGADADAASIDDFPEFVGAGAAQETSHLAFEVMGSGQPHYHFGTQGQLQLGEALAAAYLSDIGRAKPTPDRRLRDRLPFASGAKVGLYVLAGQRTMEGEDAHVTEISSHPEFAALAHDQGAIPFRYALGGGVRRSSDWEPLGPVGFLWSFGPELSFGARIRATVPRDEGVGIVKFTDSGAQGPDWSPDGTEESHRALYDRFIEAVRSAGTTSSARVLTAGSKVSVGQPARTTRSSPPTPNTTPRRCSGSLNGHGPISRCRISAG